ncbi:hypothetical protein EV182_000802 [Spiromyces aspiralis]|uniref:Uncharacterized protein n=1 Tax=Spiromyces aspiralis TaxID=68401 RepID=A0ACC1HJ35_9FUNG|nr:hypothetical protein EV182_000802 [Spiromyces aspiralis]
MATSQGPAGGRRADSNRGALKARVIGSKIEVSSNDWARSIKENYLLVDKSFILPRVIEDKSPILLTRPCSFGKTMFLSMSEDFFEVPRGETLEEKKARYRDMMVGADSEFIKKHCGQYLVIRLDLKANNLLRHFPEVHKKIDASEERLSHLQAVLNREWSLMKLDIITCTWILESLVRFLNAYHGRKCILLIDELDAPIIAASEDNRDVIKSHICDMLSPVVKSSEGLLSKCIMVSVNPISLTDMYSGLNNLTALLLRYESSELYPKDILKCEDMPYQVAFGFTEDEVRRLIATRVFPGRDNEAMVDVALNVARSWYDGYYVFQDYRIYNPWSVMNFIKALAEGEACSNEAEVLAKAQPYWIDTGSTELLTEMYGKISRINPSISRVLLWMCLDYFNIKDSIEPSDSPRTSIWVELPEPFDAGTIQTTTPYFNGRTNGITVAIAELDWDSLAGNPTLDKFMAMAYYFGYLTMIGEEYLAIPNREVLEFWTRLIANNTGSPDEPSLIRDSGSLTESLVSGNLSEFCEGLGRDFRDYLTQVDPGTSEYFYHEILLMQVRFGVDPSQYDCHSESSVASDRAGICMIPKAKGGTGILLEIKWTDKDRIKDDDHNSSSSRDDDSMVDVTKLPYCHLKECLREGIQQIEKNHYLRAFTDHCSRVLVVVPAFCGGKYLVCFKSYDYDGSKWVPSADQPSAKHKSCLPPPPDAMALVKRSNKDSSTGGRSSKKTRGSRH